MILTKVFGSGLLEGKILNLCPVYIFLLEELWKIKLHIKIDHDRRVCHDFYPMLFVQVQSHWKGKCKFFQSISFLWRNIRVLRSNVKAYYENINGLKRS